MRTDDAVLKVGDTVRNRETGELATVKYSTFGVKVGGIMEDGANWKTNGYPAEVVDDAGELA